MTTDPYNLSKPVNVAMLSLHSSPVGALGTKDTGGMSTYVLETARQLVKKGCAVDIFTRKTGPESPAVLPLGPGIRLVHLTAGGHRPIPKTALVDLKNDFMSAFHEFRKKSPVAYDLIHSHYWLSGLVGRPLSEKIQVPHCITFHTLAKFKNNTGDGDPEPAVRIDHETRLIHGCSRVIVGTQEEKTAAVRHYKAAPERVGVVPGGVDLDRFRIIPGNQARNLLGIPPSSWVILYAGRFDPLKGIDTIIESIGSLVYDCPLRRPVILLLVGGDGEGRENERLKAAADKAGDRKSVV